MAGPVQKLPRRTLLLQGLDISPDCFPLGPSVPPVSSGGRDVLERELRLRSYRGLDGDDPAPGRGEGVASPA